MKASKIEIEFQNCIAKQNPPLRVKKNEDNVVSFIIVLKNYNIIQYRTVSYNIIQYRTVSYNSSDEYDTRGVRYLMYQTHT